jgi:ATP-dependent Lhr-like helicase
VAAAEAGADGLWQLRDPRAAQPHPDEPRHDPGHRHAEGALRRPRRRPLGEVEEGFAATLTPGDTFLIGGQIVRYEGLREMTVEVTRDPGREPKIATFMGTKFATSTQLATASCDVPAARLAALPGRTPPTGCALQREVSRCPNAGGCWSRAFPHDGRAAPGVYGFAGRNAQQTLGLLLTKRMEELGLARWASSPPTTPR